MEKGEFKIFRAIAALVVVSALFFGSYWLYNQFGVEKPLADQINGITGVKKAVIDNQNHQLIIEVELGDVDNLQSTYAGLQKVIDKELKDKDYQLNIQDKRNPKLEKAYDNVQLIVYEALANNRYLWLQEEMTPRLKNIDHKIFVDQHNLYVQMKDGDNYLYEVISRGQAESNIK
ncbi:MAG: hypothetical protein ACOX6I_00770 [Syntrophomonadaceae bacterium]